MTSPIRQFNEPVNINLLRDYWAAEDAFKKCKTPEEKATAQEKMEKIKALVFERFSTPADAPGSPRSKEV